MARFRFPEPKPQSVKKFYFLDYFYVLLKSVQTFSDVERIFERFLELKQAHQLGLAKYKKLTSDIPASSTKIGPYKYTFQQVAAEAIEYLLIEDRVDSYALTAFGEQAINIYESAGPSVFNEFLFQQMEKKYHAFRYLLDVCYAANPEKSGLLIFPNYSARRLGIERSSIESVQEFVDYLTLLTTRLEQDIHRFLNKTLSLKDPHNDLLERLVGADLLSLNGRSAFDHNKYNVVLKRVRDYWQRYFLQSIYKYEQSLSSFDIWAHRGKQLGIFHITEFYPDPTFSGRIVYPLAVLSKAANSPNFQELFDYGFQKKLYVHRPRWDDEDNQNQFARTLHNAYLDIKQTAKTHFVSLPNVREKVCYMMKIPEFLFDDFLERAYHERLKIRISLEVDKLPEETNAIYLMRAPVMIDGKYRNIIAIDLA